MINKKLEQQRPNDVDSKSSTNKGHIHNTPTARKLVRHYERLTGREFPLGQYNAKITDTDNACGGWVWKLDVISGVDKPVEFGSGQSATACAANSKLIEVF